MTASSAKLVLGDNDCGAGELVWSLKPFWLLIFGHPNTRYSTGGGLSHFFEWSHTPGDRHQRSKSG